MGIKEHNIIPEISKKTEICDKKMRHIQGNRKLSPERRENKESG
jgi:hypothetical protein